MNQNEATIEDVPVSVRGVPVWVYEAIFRESARNSVGFSAQVRMVLIHGAKLILKREQRQSENVPQP